MVYRGIKFATPFSKALFIKYDKGTRISHLIVLRIFVVIISLIALFFYFALL